MEQEQLDQLVQDFLSRVHLLEIKTSKPFIVATIGLVGSGRTTVAKILVEKLTGATLVQANSARFLLKEVGLPWGENVRQILKGVAIDLLNRGYSVVFDGNASDAEDRKNIEEMAEKTGVQVFYIKINIKPELAKRREADKYNNSSWVSSFDDFRVNTIDKMLKNIDEQVTLNQKLKSSEIPNLLGEIDNSSSVDELKKQVKGLILKIQP